MHRGLFLAAVAAFSAAGLGAPAALAQDIPVLKGTWSGKTDSIGDIHGLRTRDRTIHITEQTDRRFRGYFTYEAGRKDFFGIIYPDNETFAWVSTTSKGTTQGKLLAPDRISACYIESGPEAAAACSDLKRMPE